VLVLPDYLHYAQLVREGEMGLEIECREDLWQGRWDLRWAGVACPGWIRRICQIGSGSILYYRLIVWRSMGRENSC